MTRSHLQILLFLAAVLLLGALLAPPLYWAGKGLAGLVVSFKQSNTPVIGWIGKKLASHQFDSYYNRAFLVSALGLLWPFLKWMRLSGDKLGLEKSFQRTRDALTGFLIACAFLAVLTALLLWSGAYVMEGKIDWFGLVSRAALTCIVVALLEEWLFRGIFLGVALRSSRPWVAVILVSALFSILHRIKAPDVVSYDPRVRERAETYLKSNDWPNHFESVRADPRAWDWLIEPEYSRFGPSRIHWGSGLEMTAVIFKKGADPGTFLSSFLTLFAIGIILARARCVTRSLWLPIGIHAGLIFANTVCLGMTKGSPGLEKGHYDLALGGTRIPWIGPQLQIGLAPLITLLLMAIALEWQIRRRPSL
ncbi:MAG TPA: CPBP family intramembrane glutamic endopeptidase [Verrucomicrobiales bacterium]|nr:CPBP family intramembrane glutamic endopeptidase [Verrucomicrobiales bacterium]